MPNVIQNKIDEIFDAAVQRSVIQTQIWVESNNLSVPAPDTRPADARAFEALMYENSVSSPAFVALAEKVFNTSFQRPAPMKGLTPLFNAVFKVQNLYPQLVKAEEFANGLPWGTTLMYISSKGSVRSADGKLYKGLGFNTWNTVPANEAEIRTLLNGLFAVRPAATLKLFGASMDSKVTSILAAEED